MNRHLITIIVMMDILQGRGIILCGRSHKMPISCIHNNQLSEDPLIVQQKVEEWYYFFTTNYRVRGVFFGNGHSWICGCISLSNFVQFQHRPPKIVRNRYHVLLKISFSIVNILDHYQNSFPDKISSHTISCNDLRLIIFDQTLCGDRPIFNPCNLSSCTINKY